MSDLLFYRFFRPPTDPSTLGVWRASHSGWFTFFRDDGNIFVSPEVIGLVCDTTFCFSLHLYVLQAYCLLLSFLICAKSRVFNSRLSFVRLSCVLIFHFVPVLRLAVSVEVCSFSHFFLLSAVAIGIWSCVWFVSGSYLRGWPSLLTAWKYRLHGGLAAMFKLLLLVLIIIRLADPLE